MGAFYDEIPDEDLVNWILDQKIFWVATAPLSKDGHVNVSPKGRPTFNLVGRSACWCTDMSGSGNETLSHLYENQRITIAFVAFDGPPRIVRFFGTGKVFERGTAEFYNLLPEGDERILPGTRAIIWMDIHKVGTSCGYSVPFFDYQGERLVLDNFFEKWQEGSDIRPDGVPSKLLAYWNKKNGLSIDSMPGLKLADDLSTALVPPFKLESLSSSKTQCKPKAAVRVHKEITESKTVQMTQTALAFILVSAFMLGVVATRWHQAGLYSVPWYNIK